MEQHSNPFAGSTPAKRTAQDLEAVTGLKLQYAEDCFRVSGCYEAALASFAQSLPLLPKEYFDAYETVEKNASKLNEELKLVYQKARELKTGDLTDADVWKLFQLNPLFSGQKSASAAAPASGGFPFDKKQPAASTETEAANPLKFDTKAPAASGTAQAPTGFSGFGTKAPAASGTAPAATGFVGFGTKAPDTTDAGAASSAPTFGGFGAPAAAADTEKEEKKPEVLYCEPEHFTGPLLDMPGFWEAEVVERCALLNLNGGFIEANRDKLLPRLERWVKRASFYRAPVKYARIVDRDEEVTRVIIKDADRTFNAPEHREKFVHFLHAMYHEFHAYGQAMSYLAGLCMLVLNEDDTAAVLRFVSKEYIRGHWAAEAVGFATSAWVVHYFMEKRFPAVANHLMELKFWPDTYLQKILTGLCIHVLPFQELFTFLDAFMEGGMAYLIKFCLGIVERFQDRFLAIKDSMEANKVYEMMRLDSHATNITDIRAILARAPEIDLGENTNNIDLLRSEMYEKHVLPRLQRAPKKDTFEPCALCEKGRPKWWNDDLGHVCNECKDKHPNEVFEDF
ncbi:GTPase activating protein [Strigomonas culicis]|uniref:GTPase activating protein n=1 Tax=Strigomonas culicis TaxID=28005 RepID=S9W1H7_9TRYP|nr:GTPase activating protein [Strigomonas culicis]EPY33376.1 GTPase activating protein [Strigomonas culicis]|eukprot:EPY25271.1 GTPase activating protein [Strigomonas culicis]